MAIEDDDTLGVDVVGRKQSGTRSNHAFAIVGSWSVPWVVGKKSSMRSASSANRTEVGYSSLLTAAVSERRAFPIVTGKRGSGLI